MPTIREEKTIVYAGMQSCHISGDHHYPLPDGEANHFRARFVNGRCTLVDDWATYDDPPIANEGATDWVCLEVAHALLGGDGLADVCQWRGGVWAELIALHRTGLKRGPLLAQQKALLLERFTAEVRLILHPDLVLHAKRTRRYAEGCWLILREMRRHLRLPDLRDVICFLKLAILRDEIARLTPSQVRRARRHWRQLEAA